MKKLVRLSAIVGLAASSLSLMAGDLNASTIAIEGKLSGSLDANGIVLKQTIDQNGIINLARGRNIGTPVPANEILALIVPCEADSAVLAVYDLDGGSNLVDIASSTNIVAIASGTKGLAGIPFVVNNVGDASNGIGNGIVVFTLKATLTGGGCVVKTSGSVAGTLQIISTIPGLGTFSNSVIVTKGKIKGAALPE